MRNETKNREYSEGDARIRLVYNPHGKRTYGYGHWGHEYKYVLYAYKGDKGIFTMSVRNVYAGYLKGIAHAIATRPLSPIAGLNNRLTYWLKDATWERKYRGSNHISEYPILRENTKVW